jgi:RHS repeat-associated protein
MIGSSLQVNDSLMAAKGVLKVSVQLILVLLVLATATNLLRAQSGSCASCRKSKAWVTIGFYAKACARYPYEIRIEGSPVAVGDGVCATDGWTSTERILVDLQPNVTYQFSVAAGETCSSHFNFYDIPEGYKLEIDGVETTTIDKVSERGYGGNGTWNVVVREECDSCGSGPSGTPSGPDVGSVLWGVGLGNLSDGRSAGSLSIRQEQLTAASYTPDALVYTPPAFTNEVDLTQNGNHRQVKAPESLADVVVISATEYEIRFYKAANVGSKDANGLYTLTGSAFVTYNIKNPDPATTTRFQISKTENGGAPEVSEYTWDPLIDLWTLSRSNGARSETLLVTYPTDTSRTETITVREGLIVLSKVARTYHTYSFGEELFQVVVDPDAAALTTTYTYYEDPNEVRWHKIKSISYPDGSWIKYDYDNNGSLALVLRPWKDLALASATDQNARATLYTYSNSDGITSSVTPRFVSSITEKITGIVVGSTTFNRVGTTLNGNPAVVETMRVYSSASVSQDTITTKYHSTAGVGLADRIAFIDYPDGRRETYTFEKGNYVPNADPSLSQFIVDANGQAERRTVTQGTIASPAGVAFKTTRSTDVSDKLGNQVLEETYVYNGTGYERVGWSVNTFDGRGHVTQTARHDGRISTAVWNGDRQTSAIDESGIETIYSYDGLGRLRTSTKKGIAAGGGFPAQADIITTTVYDAEGNLTQENVSNGGPGLSKTNTYDLAGRVRTSTNEAGLITSYTYSNGGRTQTVTRPGGATEFQDRYLDGQTKSITGNAVVASYFNYDLNPDGTKWTQNFIGPAGLSSPRWIKTTTDWMGRDIKVEKPTFNGTNVIESSVYNTLGQLQKQMTTANSVKLIADKLFEYDELGRQFRSGSDIDVSGTLTLLSTDRLIETDTIYEKVGNDWFLVNVMRTYLTDNNNTPVIETRRERLNNFPLNGTDQTFSEITIVDLAGNSTKTTTTTDRVAKKQTTTTDAPDSTTNAVTITINGLVQSSRFTTPQSDTTYSYDSLGRQIAVSDPRKGTTSLTYNAKGQLESATEGAGTTSYEYYDDKQMHAGRLKSKTNAALKKVYFDYNDRGELIHIWGDATYPLEYVYDAYGQQTELHTFRGGQNWGASVWPASMMGTADVTKLIFQESTGLLTQKQDPALKGSAYTYDELGRLKTRVWARGIACTYDYDANTGQLSTITYSDGTPSVTFTYDRGGRQTNVTDAAGSHTRTFNVIGELQTDQITGGILDGVGVSVGYDGFLRRNSLQSSRGATTLSSQSYGYDPTSRLETVTSGGVTATYSYYPNTGLLNATTFTGNSSIARTYDGFGRLQSITTTPAGDAAQSYAYAYNNLNQRTQVTREDGSYWSYVYNDRGELVSGKKYFSDNSIVWGAQTEYSFDNIGNRKHARSGGNQLGSLRQSDYVINSLNQYSQRGVPGMVDVTGTANANATVTVNNQSTARKGDYFYKELAVNNSSAPAYAQINVVGARNNFGAGGEDAVKETGGHVFVPQATEAFTYDDDGNITADGRWTYSWDGENRLTRMESLATVPVDAKQKLEFAYDHQSRRVQKKVYRWNVSTSVYELQSTTKFIYHGWKLLVELDGSGNLLRSYVWGTELLSINAGATTYNVGYDGNGNVGSLIQAGAGTLSALYDYDPFGQTLKAIGDYASQNSFRYSSQYVDVETGLVYYGYRYYAAQFGRWINRDPIGERGGSNLYAMLANDSVGKVDALGLAREDQIDNTKYPLTYSCNCGWIDWGHARTDGPESLLYRVTTPWGQLSRQGRGHHVIYGQQAGRDILGLSFRKGVTADYFVAENRSHAEYESIALGIFKEVSEAFERSQDDLVQEGLGHSSFSEEDLVSNLIGFYRAVKGYSESDIDTWCKVIRDKQVNHKIWQNGGKPEYKNYSWMPVFHQQAAKKQGCCPDMAWFPQQFMVITPMRKGFLWRDWLRGIDDALPPGVRPYRVDNPREFITAPLLDF